MKHTLQPGLIVLHSNQLEMLFSLVLSVMRQHPLAPLQAEHILVQSNGMKHWLEQQLAGPQGLGICAATRMDLPSTALWKVYRQVLGAERVSAHMPLDKDALTWRLFRLFCEGLQEPVYAPLHQYLHPAQGDPSGQSDASRRTYQLAVQVADVLDGYQNHRADWLQDWAAGKDQVRGFGNRIQPLPAVHRWQAALWRCLRHDAEQDSLVATHKRVDRLFSRDQVHQAFIQAMADPPQSAAGLPARLVVFGISSLPMSILEALAALAQVSQVVVATTNPCEMYWGDLRPERSRVPWGLSAAATRFAAPRWQALAEASQAEWAEPEMTTALAPTNVPSAPHGHPLLAAWGQQVRDQLHLLDVFDAHPEAYMPVFADPAAYAPASQLHQLQSDILKLRPNSEARHRRHESDNSIQWVQCHSAQREVEVLHDQVLGWLQDDPSLSTRDIMVMVPDMQHFAPHIHAVFGRTAPGQANHLPYSVADQAVTPHAWVQAIDQLMQWPQWRLSLVDWQSLFEVDAIRAAFGLDRDDIATLFEWLQASGVRWGMDAEHRSQWGMAPDQPDADHNTWAFGLRRLLLGYASGTDPDSDPLGQSWAHTVPTPGVGGLDAALISRLLDWLQAMTDWAETLGHTHTPEQWHAVLVHMLQRFFKPTQEAQEHMLERLHASLIDWVQLCTQARLDSPVPAVVVRAHWLQSISVPALHQRFLGEGVQFASLMPMRSVPFRVIALLGMNDGDYPRVRAPLDFDLMCHPAWRRMGDRSRRDDDRYLFLEALLSARERLYISWQAWRTHDHQPLPPSVLVGQLRDHLDQTWDNPAPIQKMPLHAFSPRYFQAGEALSTFDPDWAKAAQAHHMAQATDPSPPNNPARLATPDVAPRVKQVPNHAAITKHDLARWHAMLKQPLAVYYQDRLQIHFDAPAQDTDANELFGLGALQRHLALGTLLRSPSGAAQGLHDSGLLPLSGFGEIAMGQLQEQLAQMRQHTQTWRDAHPSPWATPEINLDLGEWGQLQGELDSPEWWSSVSGEILHIEHSPSKLLRSTTAKEALRARMHKLTRSWLQHLVVCALGHPTTSVVVGLDGLACWSSVCPAKALGWLNNLAALYREAWENPLPLACQTAGEWLASWRSFEAGDPQAQIMAERNARAVFDDQKGKGNAWPGEHRKSPLLRRHWASFETLKVHLPLWSERMYGPLLDNLVLTRHSPGDPA
ncbi:MAG: exodeoxyribonuclease V subunit gamma [Betaproteobacteria bacterium]|nr:exodeoxyribonuclease V subunit gamma [Betaproteobacteria bacterium]NBY06177.1 exodeoxyribonuclease V subunit gamma [Betaproteobacteria bacterium]